MIGPQSLTFGPDGNLDVFGYLGDGTGLFKLVRPVSHTGPWTYLPIYVAAKLHDAGYQPGGHLLIDKTGAAFFSALTGFDRVSPPTMLGQPWTVKQLLPSGGAHPILGALATDAFGEVLLYREGVGSLTIVSLTNTGFIPQRAPH